MRQYLGNGYAVTALSFFNYSHFLMIGYEDGTLSVYQTSTCKRVAMVHDHKKVVFLVFCLL